MNERKKLKKQLGKDYRFEKFLSAAEVRNVLSSNFKHEKLFASLRVGCVKINAVLYPTPGGMNFGYDVLVKDSPDSPEWICYDSLTDEVRYKVRNFEQEMFNVLNREVKNQGLSYTECNFEVLAGKRVSKK